MRKTILTAFVTILLASGVFAVFCLLTGNIETLMGVILAFASFAVALWCFSLRKDMRLGMWTLILALVVVLLISSTTMAYADVEPFASAKDVLILNANSNAKSLVNSTGDIIPEHGPLGTYTTQKMGAKVSVTFRDSNFLEMHDTVNGIQIYQYKISDDGETIQLTNVVTKKTTPLKFNYVKDYGIVVIDNVEYLRET